MGKVHYREVGKLVELLQKKTRTYTFFPLQDNFCTKLTSSINYTTKEIPSTLKPYCCHCYSLG